MGFVKHELGFVRQGLGFVVHKLGFVIHKVRTMRTTRNFVSSKKHEKKGNLEVRQKLGYVKTIWDLYHTKQQKVS